MSAVPETTAATEDPLVDWQRLEALLSGTGPRRATHAALADLFARGRIPRPTAGVYHGLLLTTLGPPVDVPLRGLMRMWTPWWGKRLHPDRAAGVNLFPRPNHLLYRLLMPSQSFERDGELMRGVHFRLATQAAAFGEDQTVGVIDYGAVPTNPGFVKRVRYEYVQVAPDAYLGRMLFRTKRTLRMTGYFTLRGPLRD